MAAVQRPRSELAGIALGALGTPTDPAIGAFQERGLQRNAGAIWALRAGVCTATRTLLQLEVAALVQADEASRKDALYEDLAARGGRLLQQQSRYHWRRNSNGFTAAIAREVGVSLVMVRRCLRLMRAELTYTAVREPRSLPEAVPQTFREGVKQYLAAYLVGKPQPTAFIRRLQQGWDGRSIAGFYQVCSTEARTWRSLGTWTPYEVEALQGFYAERRRAGSRLSGFDRLMLSSVVGEQTVGQVAVQVREETSVRLDDHCPPCHVHALLGQHGTQARWISAQTVTADNLSREIPTMPEDDVAQH